ncbi:MAG: TlpA disulfide reductase family protein [Eubacteriales bacterium]|nr:TlpA disulfide reductase family protein [Eubacteriales bacterium]MDY4435811.1 TlpA disulfide reductase family protein [Candidatus Flemingibacterium sp.]
MKTAKKLIAALTALVLVFVMVSCGAAGDDMTKEPKNAKEASAMHEKLLGQENEILSENSALWEKVFMAADKGMVMTEDGKNYGDFLITTIENAKDQFSDDEYTLIKGEAEKIRDIETKLTELENKFPEINGSSGDDSMSMPAGNANITKFPSFTGKDLDGNEVKSDDLFSGNAVTVVNFWFTTCGPCVSELSELDAMNKELAEKGGELIGINAFTLDGDEKSIAEAKEVLDKNGASYRNVYFDSDSDAGKFTAGIYAYPTTYVVDRNGNIVGDPIVGAITNKNQMEELQKQIDTAIATDSVK